MPRCDVWISPRRARRASPTSTGCGCRVATHPARSATAPGGWTPGRDAIPTRDADAVEAVTTDTAVLTGRIAVRYGRGAPTPPASGTSRSLRSPSFRLPHLPDPAARGPLAVTTKRYDLGDQVFKIKGLRGKVELVADVHYPRGLPAGPYRSCCSCTAITARVTAAAMRGSRGRAGEGGSRCRTTSGTTTSPAGSRASGSSSSR